MAGARWAWAVRGREADDHHCHERQFRAGRVQPDVRWPPPARHRGGLGGLPEREAYYIRPGLRRTTRGALARCLHAQLNRLACSESSPSRDTFKMIVGHKRAAHAKAYVGMAANGESRILLKTTGGFAVQQTSTATSPDSHEPSQPPSPRSSWGDGQTPSGAASSGRRGREFKSPHPDQLGDHGTEIRVMASRNFDVTVTYAPGGASRQVRGQALSLGLPEHSGRRLRSWPPTPAPPRVTARRRP